MHSDDTPDDLFRQQLGGHASEPAADLWARLQASTPAQEPAADPLDARFRTGLGSYATPPRRELWERLEDEYLRPRQRRRPVVAWGRLAIAASLLLLVLGGGWMLWQQAGRPQPLATAGQPATNSQLPTPRPSAQHGQSEPAAAGTSPAPAAPLVAATNAPRRTVDDAAAPSQVNGNEKRLRNKHLAVAVAVMAVAAAGAGEKKQHFFATQATGRRSLPSSAPVASTTALHRPATAQRPVPRLPRQQPDAAAGTLARDGGRKTPATGQSLPAPATAPTPEAYVVEVEVRRGPDPSAPAPAVVATTEPVAPRRQVRVVGLLRQADHLLHGEPASLNEARAEAAPLTLQARLGGRVISKTIRL